MSAVDEWNSSEPAKQLGLRRRHLVVGGPQSSPAGASLNRLPDSCRAGAGSGAIFSACGALAASLAAFAAAFISSFTLLSVLDSPKCALANSTSCSGSASSSSLGVPQTLRGVESVSLRSVSADFNR